MTLLRAAVMALLRLHPAHSRCRYGDEIADVVAERVARVRRERGLRAALLLALRELAGVVRAGIEARRPHARLPSPRDAPRRGEALAGAARGAWRRLLRHPAATLGAALPLMLGIGIGVPVFAVFHAVMLRPLPFAQPDRLVAIWETNPERGWVRAQVAAANYLDWRELATRGFSDIAAHNDWVDERVLVADGEPGVVNAVEVTGNFFDVLGVTPAAGETFEEPHTWQGAEAAAVLSHRFWSRRAGVAAVGGVLDLDGVPHRILGVMPEGFAYPFAEVDVWVPVGWDPASREEVWFRRAHGMRALGRLRDGVSLAEGAAELQAVAARLERLYPGTNTDMGNGLTPLREWVVGDSRRPLTILLAAVGLVLLIACANVSHLLLAQSHQRRRERWIRSALGARRSRLLLESFAESALLAALAAAGGVAVGIAALRPLLALAPAALDVDVAASPAVIALAAAASATSVVLFGSLPAWRAARAAGGPELARGASAPPRALRLASGLVMAEVALTLPLVFGAGLMLRTLGQLWQVEPGFRADGVVTARVMLPATRYPDEQRLSAFYRDLHAELRGLPGVESAALSTRLPFRSQRWSSDFAAAGWPAERYGVGVRHDEISPGLFETLEVPLLRGRDFTVADGVASEAVVIVNRALAETYFPGEDPIGQRIAFDRHPTGDSVWRTIVGVVGNVRREKLALEEVPSFYAPILQDVARGAFVVVRGDGSPIPAVRARLRSLDAALPLFEAAPLSAIVEESVAVERFLLALLAIAGAIALVLAVSGVFAVVLDTTTRRLRELAIRIALGSSRGAVAGRAMRAGLAPALAGVVAGLALSAAGSGSLSGLVYGIAPLDPLTLLGVAAVLTLAAAGAALVPARRVLRVEPSVVLRAD